MAQQHAPQQHTPQPSVAPRDNGGLRGLGWIPDVPKPNDYTDDHREVAPLLDRTKSASRQALGRTRGAAAAPPSGLPAQVDLRGWFSPIEDQGSLGSCTANAAVGLLEYFERRAFGKYVDASRLFVYKTERDLLGWTGDTGAYLRTAMEALVLFGAPPERYWPYDGRPASTNPNYDVEPSAFCYAFGQSFQGIKYFRLDPPALLRRQGWSTSRRTSRRASRACSAFRCIARTLTR